MFSGAVLDGRKHLVHQCVDPAKAGKKGAEHHAGRAPDLALGVDGEDSAWRDAHRLVGHLVRAAVAKAGVEGVPVVGEEATHGLQGGNLELVGTADHHLAVEAGQQAVGGDEDWARGELAAVLLQGEKEVAREGGLRDGPAAEEHHRVVVSLDVAEEGGHPAVAPVEAHGRKQVPEHVTPRDGAVDVAHHQKAIPAHKIHVGVQPVLRKDVLVEHKLHLVLPLLQP
mmetsp:Transcript_40596/g.114976  ORF Transcript_40596/g.114976 Transcript_40596/m.114976 type:complete len:226 (+) Transcript_40596:289-966(+)